MKQINIQIEDDFHHRVKEKLTKEKRQLKSLIVELLLKWLEPSMSLDERVEKLENIIYGANKESPAVNEAQEEVDLYDI